jgi:hypothetical protein
LIIITKNVKEGETCPGHLHFNLTLIAGRLADPKEFTVAGTHD